MVDAERLRRVLQRVSDDLATLRGYGRHDPATILSDPARLGHVKYLFVTALEGCIDAAQHVCAAEGWGPPATNADAMAVLATTSASSSSSADLMTWTVSWPPSPGSPAEAVLTLARLGPYIFGWHSPGVSANRRPEPGGDEVWRSPSSRSRTASS